MEPYAEARDGLERQDLREAFWRTLVANRGQAVYPAPASVADEYAAFEWTLGLGNDAFNPAPFMVIDDIRLGDPSLELYNSKFSAAQTFLYSAGAGSLGRCIAVTKNGRIAIVPPATRRGDTVVIIWGTQTPFSLRQREKVIEGAPCDELVGCCYVHGLMDGEGLSKDGEMFTLI